MDIWFTVYQTKDIQYTLHDVDEADSRKMDNHFSKQRFNYNCVLILIPAEPAVTEPSDLCPILERGSKQGPYNLAAGWDSWIETNASPLKNTPGVHPP